MHDAPSETNDKATRSSSFGVGIDHGEIDISPEREDSEELERLSGDGLLVAFLKTFPHAPMVFLLTAFAFVFAGRNYHTTIDAISDINRAGAQRMMSQQVILGSLFQRSLNITIAKYHLPTLSAALQQSQQQLQDRYELSGDQELQACLAASGSDSALKSTISLCNAYLIVANNNVDLINSSAIDRSALNVWVLIALGVMEMVTLVIIICSTQRRNWHDMIRLQQQRAQELKILTISQHNEMQKREEQNLTSEIKAYAAVNHNGKRVMNECVFWLEKIEAEMQPDKRSHMTEDIWDGIIDIVTFIKLKCVHGGRKCMRVLMQKAIADGVYKCEPTPQSMMDFLSYYEDTLTRIEVHGIPQWVLFDAGVSY